MTEQTARARWEDLNDEEKRVLEGHVGPGWLPQWFCNKMTGLFRRLYEIAVQERHDFGYMVGGNADFRYKCDRKLLEMMRADCDRFNGEKKRLACFVSDLIYLVVRLFGWLSFNWRERSLNRDEFRLELEKKRLELEQGTENKGKWLLLLLTIPPLLIFSLISYLWFKLLPVFIPLSRKKTPLKPSNLPPDTQDV